MRGLLVAIIIFGSIPFVLARPYIGVLFWSWVSYMNPHRLSYGFAYDFPFAAVIAGATLVGLVISREPKRIPWNSLTVTWLLLVFWMSVTTLFALIPENAVPQWQQTMKIMLISFVTAMVMTQRYRLELLVWVIVLSFGFYGLKGGLFTLLTGGSALVWGPKQSFIGDNNALALALVMTIPLMRFLQQTTANRVVRVAAIVVVVFSLVAIVGTKSRGAFLAAMAMGFMLWRRSDRKMLTGIAVVAVAIALLAFAPSDWTERMHTIKEYQQDASAMGRINAWWFAVNLALDRPLVGGGFDTFDRDLFARYAPDPEDFHDSHSIYFQMLGQHGFVGLGLFLVLGVLGLKSTGWVIRTAKNIRELEWARNLAANTQASLVGFAVGGAFLGLAYFDLYYHLMVIVVLLRAIVEKHVRDHPLAERQNQPNDRMVLS